MEKTKEGQNGDIHVDEGKSHDHLRSRPLLGLRDVKIEGGGGAEFPFVAGSYFALEGISARLLHGEDVRGVVVELLC